MQKEPYFNTVVKNLPELNEEYSKAGCSIYVYVPVE